MKNKLSLGISCVGLILISVLAGGCDSQTVPSQRLLDQMNAQRRAQSKQPHTGRTKMTPDMATGNAPAPSGGPR